jgi:hypothetical protein
MTMTMTMTMAMTMTMTMTMDDDDDDDSYLAQIFLVLGHLWSRNDVIMSWLRLTVMYLFSFIIDGRLEYKATP